MAKEYEQREADQKYELAQKRKADMLAEIDKGLVQLPK